MIQALIFDCDGTLADSMRLHWWAWHQALLPCGVDLGEADFYKHSGVPSSRVIPMLSEQQGKSVDFQQLLPQKESIFIEAISQLQPIEPVVAIARQNRGRLKMAVASGGTRRLVQLQLDQLGITDWFETIVTCEDTERHKPDPDVFLEAARRLNVDPANCRVYEDGDPGILAAERAGMQCVDVRQGIN